MQALIGKTAVVTGGGSGIGAATSKALAAEGVQVAVADINAANADAVASEIRALGGEATGFSCDVSERGNVRALALQVREIYGDPAILLANAGVTNFKRAADMSDEEWDWVYKININGVADCVRTFLPGIIAARGHIVVTASMAGLCPQWGPQHVPYCASKASDIGLVVNLAAELAQDGVGVSVLCPGRVPTNIVANSTETRRQRFGVDAERIVIPAEFFNKNSNLLLTRTPDQVAIQVIDGIRENRLFILTDHTMRGLFEQYADLVREGFDAAEKLAAEKFPGG